MKKLTYRQQQFLSQFLDLSQEIEQPMHYATIAGRLGVGKVTVYEMLRYLEEYGLVRSEYSSTSEQHGPGRPSVLFLPTDEAWRTLNQLAGDPTELEDWQVARDRILHQLREGRAGGYEDLLTHLLQRIPEKRSPLIFVTELITAMLLTLATIPGSPEVRAMVERLRRIGLPQEISLSALSGIGLALAALERINRQTAKVLLAQIGSYEELLSQLSEDNRRRLGEFAREVAKILTG